MEVDLHLSKNNIDQKYRTQVGQLLETRKKDVKSGQKIFGCK